MARPDPQVLAHQEWLGFVQPTRLLASTPPPGLVVSASALVRAGVILNRRDAEGHRLLRESVEERLLAPGSEVEPIVADFAAFAKRVLAWSFSARDYAGGDGAPIPPELEVALPEYGETLRPDFAVREPEPADGTQPWQLLVRVLDPGEDLDREVRERGRLEASAHGRMERLLRATGVPAGLLCNGRVLRLVSAPRRESSGWLEFRVADMTQTAGRPIATALRELLQAPRLLTLPREQRLAALLEASRRFQNEVSERLAVQVLEALYELLRGFQAAHDVSGRELLSGPLAERPDEVYRALLTVILRLVFLLYAEEREMLPGDATFLRFYSLAGLHERLREDDAQYPDTMNQRYGAWAHLLALFRMVHEGADTGDMSMPPRRGALFDPDRFPFLEGRRWTHERQARERIEPPLVPDGTVHRALDKLLVLDGERISYRALDVEQIGSVYETMMGFSLEVASGRSLAIKAQGRYGAPTTIDLEALLALDPAKRGKWLKERTGRELTPKVGEAVKGASTIEDLHAALLRVVDAAATPDLVPKGAMVLQPSAERRHSGSHYTPRELTEPIVRTTLAPILDGLRGEDGGPPRPEQILELKVCDPAMGSGAFLVEACRQLGDALIDAWSAHGGRPEIPPDEVEVVFAQRLVAQRCLYGVDRNAMAVDLAKMSLWLVTLAREHPLTFVDHALHHGDSLVGLSRKQLESFHWKSSAPGFEAIRIDEHLARVAELRAQIREAGEDVPDSALRDMWDEAQAEMVQVRLFGDLVVAAFFLGEKNAEREAKRQEFADAVRDGRAGPYRGLLEEMREAEPPLVPFHWELELPEVFARERPGFDAIVGNPPFAGKNTMAGANPEHYSDWLKQMHEQSHGNSDLVAHFFRRGFELIRTGGSFGLIATNTIGQGDTRATGLRWICTHGGVIYSARRRVRWPGRAAAVVVSVIHVLQGAYIGQRQIDGRSVDVITAYLFHRGGHEDPARLTANAGKSFIGSYVLGMGFTFDDSDTKGVASSLAEMRRVIDEDPRNAEVILPYIGGAEVNASPGHTHHRYVINFGERSEEECRQRWPDLMAIVETKVKPKRLTDNRASYRRYWWQYAEKRLDLQAAVAGHKRVLVISQTSGQPSFLFLPTGMVYSHKLVVCPLESLAAFAALQCQPHDMWARFFGSTMKDDPVYTPSDCFETFPFPAGWESDPALKAIGKTYYEFRAALMKRNDEGLTKTYNRFHDPYENDPDIEKLRTLHTEMDRAVLHAYGWDDIPTECEFLLDYPIDEEEWGKKKKPYRFRWPDDVRDEVLARLIELNTERAAAEQRSGAATAAKKKGRKATAGRAVVAAQAEGLF